MWGKGGAAVEIKLYITSFVTTATKAKVHIRVALDCLLKKIKACSFHHPVKNIFLSLATCINIKFSCRLGIYLNRVR